MKLTIREAASLDLCNLYEPTNKSQCPDRLVACDFNDKTRMIRLVSDECRIRRTDPKPCPFCDNQIPSVQHIDANRMGVLCGGCGASITVPCPEEFPEGIETLEKLDLYMGLQAVARWNRRVN
ncbi:MAG: hypothetical protein ACXAC5_01390 [Promethearchaeota archaeon]